MKWGTYMKLVTKYQFSAINSCWEKCDEKCAYMFNVYKNQLSLQTGSRNLTGPKTLPTIWYTYMTLVTKYQKTKKCDEKYLGRTEGRTEVEQYTPFPFGKRGYNKLEKVDLVITDTPALKFEKIWLSHTLNIIWKPKKSLFSKRKRAITHER